MTDSSLAVFDTSNFDAEVLTREGLVLVDFWSEGCAPCKQLTRLLTQLTTEIPSTVRIGTVNVGENPALTQRYSVRVVPTLLFFRDGALVETRTGVDRKQVLKKLVDMHA